MQYEHQKNTDDESNEGRIEGHAETDRNAHDVSANRLIRLAESGTDTSNRAEEAYRGDCPGNVADDGQFRFHAVGLGFTGNFNSGRDVLNVSGGLKSVEAGEQGSWQEKLALGVR